MSHASSQRRLVRLVFSASVLTLLGSLTLCIAGYADFMVGPGALMTGVSIITSNLLVLVCWFYHYLAKERGQADESDAYITPHWTRNHELQPDRAGVQTRLSVLSVPRSTIEMIDTVASDVSTSSEHSKGEQKK
ncbi:hypothetical protein CVT25_000583 [Psilocybe cyanescens]|uniref:Uncharacterized protein n=1 Tax=Psilocybe cyanescens TaxID=93625 RepID=A0A409WZW3_PSICY|nr:hypothetical protein CVT25_000583 [Psilocybe cyanescens]